MPLPELESPRLRLRAFQESDIEELYRLWINPEVRRYLWDDQVISRELAAETIRQACFLLRKKLLACGWCSRRTLAAWRASAGFAGSLAALKSSCSMGSGRSLGDKAWRRKLRERLSTGCSLRMTLTVCLRCRSAQHCFVPRHAPAADDSITGWHRCCPRRTILRASKNGWLLRCRAGAVSLRSRSQDNNAFELSALKHSCSYSHAGLWLEVWVTSLARPKLRFAQNKAWWPHPRNWPPRLGSIR